ncbi:hypothetical protein [Desulfosediminicola sp.]|uniref:hypothetical protein n=1 Tax=Desulfosediminicola sp. TaxID=2886825 RepID=UPI003AF2A6C5
MKFRFPRQSVDSRNMQGMMEKMPQSNQVVMEVEGVMYMFPYTNIKYIRVSPCPDVLPEVAIQGVQLSGE